MDRRHLVSLAAFATLAVAMTGCPDDAPKPTSSTSKPATTGAATAKPTATATAAPTGTAAAAPAGNATLKGTVKLTGKAPEMKTPTARAKAEFCKDKKEVPYNAVVVSKDGGLKDTLVRIENGGVKGKFEIPKTHATIEQKDCMYSPRIQGVIAGQDIDIKNADGTLHNVHTYKGSESWFNQGQPKDSPAISKTLPDDPTVVKFACDVHPWMRGFVIVTDHPFFAVTDDSGKFSIGKVPAGKYNVEAWHSHYGLKKGTAEVKESGDVEVNFTYEEGKDGEPAENKDELKGLW